MLDKKQIENGITSLEDVKGLYTQLEQAASDASQQQNFKTMLGDIERHYHYLNSILLSFRQK